MFILLFEMYTKSLLFYRYSKQAEFWTCTSLNCTIPLCITLNIAFTWHHHYSHWSHASENWESQGIINIVRLWYFDVMARGLPHQRAKWYMVSTFQVVMHQIIIKNYCHMMQLYSTNHYIVLDRFPQALCPTISKLTHYTSHTHKISSMPSFLINIREWTRWLFILLTINPTKEPYGTCYQLYAVPTPDGWHWCCKRW